MSIYALVAICLSVLTVIVVCFSLFGSSDCSFSDFEEDINGWHQLAADPDV